LKNSDDQVVRWKSVWASQMTAFQENDFFEVFIETIDKRVKKFEE